MSNSLSTRQLARRAVELRIAVINMLVDAKSGHSAGPLGLAEIFAALYFRFLNVRPKQPDWEGRDRFVLSCGHVAPILYAALAYAGFFPLTQLKTLRKLNSPLQGHTHNLSTSGVETTGGPLAQGISQAVGMALGFRMDHRSQRVWCVCSDGEHDEGQLWEAVMLAAKYQLDNLVVIVDRNQIQIDGFTEEVLPLGKLEEKYRAFGWQVYLMDGNELKEVISTLEDASAHKGEPTVVIAHTVPGKGVSFMENKPEWHGKPPTSEEAELALAELERALEGLK